MTNGVIATNLLKVNSEKDKTMKIAFTIKPFGAAIPIVRKWYSYKEFPNGETLRKNLMLIMKGSKAFFDNNSENYSAIQISLQFSETCIEQFQIDGEGTNFKSTIELGDDYEEATGIACNNMYEFLENAVNQEREELKRRLDELEG